MQGSLLVWTQPGRYNVTSSLIGWAHIQNDPCDAIIVFVDAFAPGDSRSPAGTALLTLFYIFPP